MPSEQREQEAARAGQRDSGASQAYRASKVVPRSVVEAGRQPREKRSVTLDATVAQAVDQLVDSGAAESFSAAINEAAARWVANQQLGRALDELYEQDPDVRPSPDAVRAAAAKLGLA